MQTDRGVLLVGGKGMGKTNFLARLWGAAYKARTGILRYDGLPDDLEHLNTILDCILSGSFAGRTNPGELWHCEIPLTTRDSSEFRGNLIVPDCPGEEWHRIYEKNEWSEVWENIIDNVSGCLFFVRPKADEFSAPLDWITCAKICGTNKVDLPTSEHTPTQVEMVYWMQILRHAQRARNRHVGKMRIGVIVSAWDALPPNIKKAKPSSFIETEMPLLHQFMATNTDEYQFTCFGVSIAGGDLTLEDYKKKYREVDPYSSGYVIHELRGKFEQDSDHTLPVAWALGLDCVMRNSVKDGE